MSKTIRFGFSPVWGVVSGIVVVGLVGWAVIAPKSAVAKDSDGSRLGAQPQEIGTTESDDLDPPEDEADWRYIEVKEERVVQFDLHVDPKDASLEMTLTKATGDELKSTTSNKGRASLQRKLAPGLYYLEVAGDSAADYEISIQ